MIALDASALLAFMFEEPGQEQVRAVVTQSCLSTVNLAEVVSRLARDGLPATTSVQRIAATDIEIVPFDQEQARIVGELLPATRHKGLSLGDRACLAMAMLRGIPAMTADHAWLDLELGIEIRSLR